MSKIGELFDSALEGYARGSNPRYAKQQDARQLARDMYGVQQAIGKTGMAGHPMESALLMMQSANPVLQQHALNSMQEYQNRKSESIKNYEYRANLSDEENAEYRQLVGEGWSAVGDKFDTYHPTTGRPVKAILMQNALGETKTHFIAPVHAKSEKFNVGGVEQWRNQPGVGPGAMPGWGNDQRGVPGAQPVPQTPRGNATAAVNAPQGAPTNMGGSETPATGGGVPPSPAAPPMISNQPVPQAAPTAQTPSTGDPMLDMVIRNKTAIQTAEAKAGRESEKAGQKRSDWLGIQGGRDQADQFANKAYEALQLIDKHGSKAAGFTADEAAERPNTPASDFHSTIESLKSDIVLGGMKELKMASETGSTGFGQMSIPELNMLIARIEALDPANTPEKIRQDIVEITMRMERMNWMAEVGNVMKHSKLPEWDPETHSGGDDSLEAAAAYYGVEPPVANSDRFAQPTAEEPSMSTFDKVAAAASMETGLDRKLRRYGLDDVAETIQQGKTKDALSLSEEVAPPGAGKKMIANDLYDFNKWIEDKQKAGQQRRADLKESRAARGLGPTTGMSVLGGAAKATPDLLIGGKNVDKITDAAMSLGKSTAKGVVRGATASAFKEAAERLPDTKAGKATKVVLTGTIPEIREHFGKKSGVAEAVELVRTGTDAEIQAATQSAMVRKPGFMDALEVLITGTPEEIYEFFRSKEE